LKPRRTVLSAVTEDTDQEVETDVDAEVETVAEETEDVVVDLDSAEAYEQRVDQLQETVETQQEQIEELEGLLLDLSTRVADDRGMGVCPECHGPVEKVRRWFRPTTIECRRCGEVFHEF
jgi:RNA polymerase-binding transcription factor DksA